MQKCKIFRKNCLPVYFTWMHPYITKLHDAMKEMQRRNCVCLKYKSKFRIYIIMDTVRVDSFTVSSLTSPVFITKLIRMLKYWIRNNPKCIPEYILLINTGPVENLQKKWPKNLINRMFGNRSATMPETFWGCTCICWRYREKHFSVVTSIEEEKIDSADRYSI